MLTPKQILFGDLPPQQRRMTRIPLAMASAVAFVALLHEGVNIGADAARSAYAAAETNYGCDSAPIPQRAGAVAGAIAVRDKLHLASNSGLNNALTEAAQQAQSSYAAEHGKALQPGQLVEACITHNSLAPEGWGNGGWVATVAVLEN